eukprot:jgi/Ulvmu1/802/UM010_0176.1
MVNKFHCLTEYDASPGGQALTPANAYGREHPLAGMDNFAGDSAHASISEVVSSDADPPRPVKQPMVWVDLEMTGLDVGSCTILAIACFITSGDLRRVFMGPDLHIHHSDEVLASMNEWSEKTHGESGLTERCRDSTVSMAEAEEQVLSFVKRHCRASKAPLTGNSVHIDKEFLQRYMPRLHAFLHFRIIDVSTLNELSKRWTPGKLNFLPRKTKQHTAMADLLESLEELRTYQNHMFGLSHKGHPIFVKYQPAEDVDSHAAEADEAHSTPSPMSTGALAEAGQVKRVGRQIRRKW